MNAARFALRALRREWRSGEVRALFAAVLIAVAAITSVGFFADRIEGALRLQAGELLAADLRVVSPAVPPANWFNAARQDGLRTGETLSFPSVVVAGDRTHLAAVKAVGPAYPLRGRLQTARRPFGPTQVVATGPGKGSVWVDPQLFRDLRLRLGDEVQVGAASLRVTRVLAYEPDRGGDLFSVAPRLMMNLADVPATRLVQPGSRVRYAVLVAGAPRAVARFRSWLAPRLDATQHLEDLGDARPQLRTAIERGRHFLGLAALVAVLVAGVAIAISARRYAARHLDNAAVLRCLGARQAWLTRTYLLQVLWIGLGGGVAGTLVGFGAQSVLAALLGGVVGGDLPPPGWLPALAGLSAGLVALCGFALPPLLRIRRVPPLRVLRRDLGPLPAGAVSVYGSALAAVTALAVWQAGELRLALMFLGGAAVTVLALGGCAWLLVRALSGLRRRVGVAWRFGLANIVRRAGTSAVQVLGFGLGVMALVLLTLVRTDLLSDWRHSLPPDAPNQFAINIQTAQLPAVRDLFRSAQRTPPRFYPMVRGRLAAVNGRPVDPSAYSDPRARHLVERDFNLSWAERPQAGNRVVAGHWWPAADTGIHQFSVEAGIARRLGIHLGDRLTYRVAGETVDGTVTSLRSVQWDSFHPNFFVVTPPGLLQGYPTTWICSFHLAARDKDFISTLVHHFPNVTVIDVEALMNQVRRIMDRVSLAVQYVFLFTLGAGLVVLYAAVQATQHERLHEGAVLRTLGAGRRQLLLGLVGEFVTLGLLAGLLGAVGASVVGYFLAEHVLDLPLAIHPLWWLAGMLGGGIGVGLAGIVGARHVLRQSPLQTLRRI